jgi:hypothetical protein
MKTSIFILSLLICTSLNAQKGSLNESRWHLNDEVQSSDYQPINKAKLYCFLSNDNDNIYIDIKIADAGVQNRILKEGLIIWINMDGKSAKKMGVRYPIGSQNPVGRNKPDYSENTTNQDRSLVSPLSLANTIELIGFINEEVRHFPSQNSDNFRGSVKYDKEGILYYKMVMPIAKLPVRNSKQGNGAMPFAIGIEYGSSTSVNKSGNQMSPPPSSSFSSGGSRGGVSGGGRSGGGGRAGRGGGIPANAAETSSNSDQPAITPVLKWIKDIKLSTSK